MKNLKILVVLLLIFSMLWGCGVKQSSKIDKPKNTDLSVENLPVEIVDALNEYPIVIVDTTNDLEKARVICFCRDGEVISLDDYTYGENTLRDLKDKDDVLNQTTILDLSGKIKLVDHRSETLEIQPLSMHCTERMLDETLEFYVGFEPALTEENRFSIGTYVGIDIFPKEITYQGDTVQADLDGNGQMDCIEWSFTPTTTYYEVKSDYTISVNRNGALYSLVEETYIPLDREDVAVFVVDINQDGEFEIVVYANGMSQFGHLSVYTFMDNQYSLMFDYAVDCEP